MKGKTWVAFYTIREDKIRIISARRARKGEWEIYESKKIWIKYLMRVRWILPTIWTCPLEERKFHSTPSSFTLLIYMSGCWVK